MEFIENAILSVLKQKFVGWEHIIVDGGSTDSTIEILKQYSHLKWISESDDGIYDAMNKGVKIAQGEWVYFLGADDELYDIEVLRRVSMLMTKKTDVIYGNVLFKHSEKEYDGKFTKIKLLSRNICHQGIFVRKDLFRKYNGFNTRYKMLADWHFNMKWFNDLTIRKDFINNIIATYNEDGSCFNTLDTEFKNDWQINVNKYFPWYISGMLMHRNARIIGRFIRKILNYEKH